MFYLYRLGKLIFLKLHSQLEIAYENLNHPVCDLAFVATGATTGTANKI